MDVVAEDNEPEANGGEEWNTRLTALVTRIQELLRCNKRFLLQMVALQAKEGNVLLKLESKANLVRSPGDEGFYTPKSDRFPCLNSTIRKLKRWIRG